MKRRMTLLEWGVMIWGVVAIALMFLILLFLGAVAIGWEKKGGALYEVLKDFSTLIGAIVGFSGVAWSHFFTATRPDAKEDGRRSARAGAGGDCRRKPDLFSVGGIA
jgi:hypothetical protein